MGKLLTFILGIIVGIVLLLGGTVGVGYYLATQPGSMGKIEDALDKYVPDNIKLTEDIRSKSVLEYAKGLVNAATKLGTITIGEFEDAFGFSAISQNIYNILGVPVDTIKASTFGDLGKTLSSNITVENASDNLGIELPGFPVFEDPDFLSSPVSTAFASLETHTLDGFVEVVYDEDATPDTEASSPVLQRLGRKTLEELSTDMDAIIDDIVLSEIVDDADEDSIIYNFLHLKVGELGTEGDKVVQSLPLHKLTDIDENSPKVLRALRDCTLVTQYEEDGVTVSALGISDALNTYLVKDLIEIPDNSHIWTYLGEFTLDTLGQAVEDMTVAQAVDTDDPDCHIVIKRLADTKVSDIGTELTSVLEVTTIGELITIDETDPATEPMLIALKDVYLEFNALNTAISNLRVMDVFRNYDSGSLSLVDPETPLKILPDLLSSTISSSNLYRLSVLGIYSFDTSSSTAETKSVVYNSTPNSLINRYLLVAGDPSQAAALMSPVTLDFIDSVLDQTAVDSLTGFQNGVTLKIYGNVAIPDDTVFTSLFNIDCTEPGAALDIGSGVQIDLGADGYGYMYVKGNVAVFNEITSVYSFNVTPGVTAPSILIEYQIP